MRKLVCCRELSWFFFSKKLFHERGRRIFKIDFLVFLSNSLFVRSRLKSLISQRLHWFNFESRRHLSKVCDCNDSQMSKEIKSWETLISLSTCGCHNSISENDTIERSSLIVQIVHFKHHEITRHIFLLFTRIKINRFNSNYLPVNSTILFSFIHIFSFCLLIFIPISNLMKSIKWLILMIVMMLRNEQNNEFQISFSSFSLLHFFSSIHSSCQIK